MDGHGPLQPCQWVAAPEQARAPPVLELRWAVMVAASGRGNQAGPASGPVTIASGPGACGFESLAIATGDSDSTPDSLDRPRVTRTGLISALTKQ